MWHHQGYPLRLSTSVLCVSVSCVQRTQDPIQRTKLSYTLYQVLYTNGWNVGKIRMSKIDNGINMVDLNQKAVVQHSFMSSLQDTLICLMLIDFSRKIGVIRSIDFLLHIYPRALLFVTFVSAKQWLTPSSSVHGRCLPSIVYVCLPLCASSFTLSDHTCTTLVV